jgi:tetratricopeptide (TPR) repeat protein
MDKFLDLGITLVPPPANASPEVIAGIELRCDQLGLQHTGDILKDPLTATEREELRWYLEEYPEWPYEQFLERGKKIEASLSEIGKRLYSDICGSVGAIHVVQSWSLQPGGQRQISIISDLPKVLSLPWELLHDEQSFLVLRTHNPVSLLRRLPQYELAAFPIPFKPPLRILLVTARPDNAGFVDSRSSARELLEEIQQQEDIGVIALEFLRPPTLPALHRRLSNAKLSPVHVLHFDGHSLFSEEDDGQGKQHLRDKKQGLLAFEDDDGKLDLVRAEDVAQVLQDNGVRLVVLDACQSAMSTADDAFSSIATYLIRSGVDAVVTMSASLLVASSIGFFEVFYRELMAGTPAPTAQERARQVLHDNPRRYIHRRRRDDMGQPMELRDWWLPHYYQQRPLVLQPTKTIRKGKKQQATTQKDRLNESMPTEPRYGFSGRDYELIQLERHLQHSKLVVIHGIGGVGKTALARETADWLTRTGGYSGACFVSFEHGGDSAMLLSALGNYLGVYDGYYNPHDQSAALRRLKMALEHQPTMVIADNLESILPGGEAPLDVDRRIQLWDVLLELSQMGAGVLLTSRDTNFGDGRLTPGKRVAHLLLGGLNHEDAYALASRLLEDLQIDRARAPYIELRDLLAQLDYHPLAIQQVLPALRTIPLGTIRADFGTLLPKFSDDTETGRNRSLLASLDYSLKRLSEELRRLLPRLSLFEGGASEGTLLMITEIPIGEWIKLRLALEQAALMTIEHVHETIAVPFLRFHPVLIPYLRLQGQPSSDDPTLHTRYAQLYYVLANSLYQEDDRHPQSVRALVQRELPNFRQALELLLEADDQEAATNLVKSIAKFLTSFGLERERATLWQRVVEVKAIEDIQVNGKLTRGALTQVEWVRERGLGEDEWSKGNLRAASTRYTNLLENIEAQPEGMPLGRGSYEHCVTLHHLASCLEAKGQSAAAERRLREALAIIEGLIRRHPDERIFILQRAALLTSFGSVLLVQGQYPQARNAYEESFQVYKQRDDQRGQAMILGQLGTLALMQRDYARAHLHYTTAFEAFRALDEPAMEALAWHQLGVLAEKREEWTEAERCYRKSLALKEQLDDTGGVAETCNHLALVAQGTGRLSEAEGWLKRALSLVRPVYQGTSLHASCLDNLANLLLREMREGRISSRLLSEAQSYAEQAFAIKETFDISSEIWMTLDTLAGIAELDGRVEKSRNYRRRARETFASFSGNRYFIDRQHWSFIADIAAAILSDVQAREVIEKVLLKLGEDDQDISAAVFHIWAGERDWHSLVEDLNNQDALLILRVLETIAQSGNT